MPETTPRIAATARWSLRTRLLVLLVSSIAVVFSVGTVQSYRAQREAAQDLFDGSLRETARLLLQLAQHEITEHGLVLGVALLNAEVQPGPYDFRYQIWTDDMRSAYRTANLPATPLMPIHADGLDWTVVDGERWRAFAAWNEAHTLQIQIAQSQARRRDLDRSVLLRVLANIAIMMAGASALVWIIVNASLRPLQATARAVAERSAGDLRPIDAGYAPVEVRPLLDAINRLLARIRDAFATERRFTADAAHELRTPLAAIRVNAQVLVGARDDAERQATARDLIESVDRSTRLVEQLLALARADSAAELAPTFEPVDLAQLATEALAGHERAAQSRGIRLEAVLVSCIVDGVRPWLLTLLRNLLDNAIRFIPDGGHVVVRCGPAGDGAELRVSDDGPGIPAAQRQLVFERFRRLPDTSATGSGLGLSIVRRIAELHGATVGIDDGPDGRGTTVVLRFPALCSATTTRTAPGQAPIP